MNRALIKCCIAFSTWVFGFAIADAHDAWLSAKWNAKKTHIVISPVVAESFPNGEPIKDMKRFTEPSAYFPDGRKLSLSGDPQDSTVLGSFSLSSSCIVSAGVKQREITYDQKIAWEYLTEEIGLTKAEVAKIITPGVKEFSETYSRNLKTLVVADSSVPRDSSVGLPLEIVLLSWKDKPQRGSIIQFRLLEDGKSVAGASIRVMSNGKSTVVKTDSTGVAEAILDTYNPILLAHIKLIKLSESRLQSVWTNLTIYRLEK